MKKEYGINKQRLIKSFIEMAKISSPSWKEGEMVSFLIDFAKKHNIFHKVLPCGPSKNLYFHIPGTLDRKPILFAAHTDTVTPCDNINVIESDDRIKTDGKTILGADDKAAIAAFLEAYLVLKESETPHGDIEFLFTCAEEIGIEGIKKMDFSILKSKRGIVFDCDGPIGTAIMKAPYHTTMAVEIKGKAAHAGMEPEKGISAIRVISEIITALPHGRVDGETTTNVGIVTGGRATNIIAPSASFILECRSINLKKLKNLEKKIIRTINSISKKHKTKARITQNMEYKGFILSDQEPIIEHYRNAAKKAGIKPRFTSSGGGSDTNVLIDNGIMTLNLSIGMKKMHSTDEYIMKKDIFDSTALVLALIETA